MRRLPAICALALLILSSCTGAPQRGNFTDYTSLDDLKGRRVGVITGSVSDICASGVQGTDTYHVNSVAELILACETGKVDCFFCDSTAVIGSGMESKGIGPCWTYPDLVGHTAFGVSKSRPELRQSLNRFLSDLEREGTLSEIRARWKTGDVANAPMPELTGERNGKPLRVAVMPDFPFTFVRDGEWVGMEAEILERYAEREGRPIEYSAYDFAAVMSALATGKADLCACYLFVTEERKQSISFTDTYDSTRTTVFARISDAVDSGGPALSERFRSNFVTEERWRLILEGLKETAVISLLSILLGTLLGMLMCAGLMSRRRWLTRSLGVFNGILAGIPQLVLLMIMFYVVFASTPLTGGTVAVVTFSILMGSGLGEVFRTAILTVPAGQTEAGLALGFGKLRTFILIVLPQALKVALPIYRSQCTELIKGTSIVGYIAVHDLTRAGDIIRSRTFDAFFPLLAVTVVYFAIVWLCGFIIDFIYKRIR